MKKKFKKLGYIKISEKQVKTFCNLTEDKNPIHINKKYASKTKFKSLIAPGILIISKINKIISKKYTGAIILDINAEYREPVLINQKYNCKYEIVKKKNYFELKSTVFKKIKNILITINFIN